MRPRSAASAVLAAIAFLACASVPDGVTVWTDSPASVEVGERFTIAANIQNHSTESVRLRSLDIGETYLQGIEILASEPRFSSLVPLSVDGTLSYGFEIDIPAGSQLVVKFDAQAKHLGVHQGDFDFCVNSKVNCFFLTITTPARAGQ